MSTTSSKKTSNTTNIDETEATATGHHDEEAPIEKKFTVLPVSIEENSDSCKANRRKKVIIGCIIAVVVLILVIVLPITLTKDNDSKDKSLKVNNELTGGASTSTEIDTTTTTPQDETKAVEETDDIDEEPSSNNTFGTIDTVDTSSSSSSLWDCSLTDVTFTVEVSIANINTLFQQAGKPDDLSTYNPALDTGYFNPQNYLQVLNHLSIDDTKTLDMVYEYDGAQGYPTIYVRDINDEPYNMAMAYTGTTKDYLNEIRTDDTPEGYIQLVILDIIGDQFYLFWHALMNNDHRVVYNMATVDEIFNKFYGTTYDGEDCFIYCLTDVEKELASNIDYTPTVQCGENDTVIVSVVTFTEWGGFYRRTYTLAREGSSNTSTIRFLSMDEENLISFNSGKIY